MTESIVMGARAPSRSRIIFEYVTGHADFRIAFVNRSGASHVRGAVPAGGVNLFLRIVWRTALDFAKQDAWCCGVG
ncbi:hypothetical protein [Bradyrhizobium sp. S69]|uniref:hypothetical protein n=1 Tax=Bradyrhizobium sp. S69 TaxID=1641856 RepID=UPI00131CC7F4|nr:hypothetical protein [Bradyrhizobium sp. S69]